MSQHNSKVQVAKVGDTVYFRIAGLGSMRNATILKDFADKSLTEGMLKYVFDMDYCSGVDSTFMGVITGIALHEDERTRKQAGVVIVNASQPIRKLFDDLGVSKFTVVTEAPYKQIKDLEMEVLEGGEADAAQRLDLIRRAHENLIKIEKSNLEKFGPFLEALTQELNSRKDG